MFNIEAIEVTRVRYTHITKDAIGYAHHTNHSIELSEQMSKFFSGHILKCLGFRSIRAAQSSIMDGLDCAQIRNKYLDVCAGKYQDENLLVVLFTDMETELQYTGILLMPEVQAYQIRTDGLCTALWLPNPDKALSRFAIVRNYESEEEYNVLFRNNPVYDNEDSAVAVAWFENFLEATEVPTPRHRTELVMKESEKFIGFNQDMMDDEREEQLRAAVRVSVCSDECDIEHLAEIGLSGDLREAYIGRLLDKGLGVTTFKPDREWAQKQIAKTTLVCDDGIKITGPSDVIDDVIQVMPKTADRKTRLVIETRKFQQK